MKKVFMCVSYDVFQIPDFLNQLNEFTGGFHIEQTEEESIQKLLRIYFFVDENIDTTISKDGQVELDIMMNHKEPITPVEVPFIVSYYKRAKFSFPIGEGSFGRRSK